MILYTSPNKDINTMQEFVNLFRRTLTKPSNITIIDDIRANDVLQNYKPRKYMTQEISILSNHWLIHLLMLLILYGCIQKSNTIILSFNLILHSDSVCDILRSIVEIFKSRRGYGQKHSWWIWLYEYAFCQKPYQYSNQSALYQCF